MADIVVSEFMDEDALGRIGPAWSVLYDPALVDDRDRLIAELGDAAALIVRNRTRVDAGLLAAGPRLKAVGRLGVGLDNIDLAACQARNVAVLPATGANTVSVAEYVLAAALSLVRPVFAAGPAMRAGEWPRQALIAGEVFGKTLGLVGYGGIARAVADRARAFDMRIAAHDPFLAADDPAWAGVQNMDLDDLLATADIVSLHVPLTDGTRHLIDTKALDRMKPAAIVINTARGGVVDEVALVEALKAGRLGGAALDVFETEPLDAMAGATFADVPNLILTPHVAGVTDEGNVRVSEVTVANVLAVLENENA